MRISLVSSRSEERDGYTLHIRTNKSSNCGYDSRLHCDVTVTRNGVEITSGGTVGPEDEDIIATGKVGELEEAAICKAIEKANLIKMAIGA